MPGTGYWSTAELKTRGPNPYDQPLITHVMSLFIPQGEVAVVVVVEEEEVVEVTAVEEEEGAHLVGVVGAEEEGVGVKSGTEMIALESNLTNE